MLLRPPSAVRAPPDAPSPPLPSRQGAASSFRPSREGSHQHRPHQDRPSTAPLARGSPRSFHLRAPVPQPAVPREALSEALQNVWTRTEEIVADRPPEPPAEATEEAIAAWANDPFAPWVERRRLAIEALEPLVAEIGETSVERPLAGAFFGYMYEDTAAGIRGAPVPDDLAHDAELLDIYVHTLDEALRPFAQRALESYAYCATVLARQPDETWLEWARYCLERGRDVGEVFHFTAGSADESADGGSAPADGATPAPAPAPASAH